MAFSRKRVFITFIHVTAFPDGASHTPGSTPFGKPLKPDSCHVVFMIHSHLPTSLYIPIFIRAHFKNIIQNLIADFQFATGIFGNV